MKKARPARPAGPVHAAQAFMARLRLDHARLSRVLREVEVQRARLAREPDEARAVLAEALGYLLEYQHRHHHPREDRLYERLASVRAELGERLRELGREHDGGSRRARRLSAALDQLASARPQGRAVERFARDLQCYVDETREHMRGEERAVLYAGVEDWLTVDEWRALAGEAVPEDPLGDAVALRRKYPRLSAALAEPVRDVSGAAAAAPQAPQARSAAALRDGAEELVDAYGALLHEGLDLVRANLATLWGAPSPIGAVQALPEVSRRSYRFAARCVALPSRVALQCASRMLTPFAASSEPPADD